jgi:hypothetical protein
VSYFWWLLAAPAGLLIALALYGIWVIQAGVRRYRKGLRCLER